MSHGPGALQRAILEFMQRYAARQRSPQRDHFPIEQLALNLCQPASDWASATSRHRADARKRVRRACASLMAAGKLVKKYGGWALPPETPQEARARRKRFRISERAEREQQERERQDEQRERWSERRRAAQKPIDPALRDKLAKVLGMLGSTSDGEVMVAARQAERLRLETGLSWAELIARYATVK